jgi:hypothetical protein
VAVEVLAFPDLGIAEGELPERMYVGANDDVAYFPQVD